MGGRGSVEVEPDGAGVWRGRDRKAIRAGGGKVGGERGGGVWRREADVWRAEPEGESTGAVSERTGSAGGYAGGGVPGEVDGVDREPAGNREGGRSVCAAGCGLPGGAAGDDDGGCGSGGGGDGSDASGTAAGRSIEGRAGASDGRGRGRDRKRER